MVPFSADPRVTSWVRLRVPLPAGPGYSLLSLRGPEVIKHLKWGAKGSGTALGVPTHLLTGEISGSVSMSHVLVP